MEDLSGKQFNNWFVLEYCGKSEWLCQCQCEKKTLRRIRTYMLKSGGSKSCGCGRVTLQVKDLRGERFGNWLVKEYAGDSKWLCECQCDNKTAKIIAGRDLKSGDTKSCGCLKRKDVKPYGAETVEKEVKVSPRLKEDLSGKTFGNWLVLKYSGDYKWLCQCQCEKKTIRNITRYDLINSRSTNCGCKRSKDLAGRTFGRLYVHKYLGNMTWECQCSCENKTIVKVLTCNLVNGGTKSCGCLKNESRYSKEEFLDTINRLTIKLGEPPYIEDIAEEIKLHKENVRHNINKYGLYDMLNKHFRSKPERDICRYIESLGVNTISSDKTILNGREIDIYIPSHKIAIEFNGNYWHSTEKIHDKRYHQDKTIDCAKKGIQLIHIFEYEWDDLDKQIKLKNYLKRLLTKDSQKTVYARNTEVKQIPREVANEFCEKYHLQNSADASVNYGCYLESDLLGVMTFSAPRFNNNYDWEIVRLCWKDGIGVTGGTEKLFKRFIKDLKPSSIITYSDISKFTGNVYTRLGFKPIQPNPITEPNYVWVSQETDLVLPRYKTQKHKLVEVGLGNKEQTEQEIMINNNFIQVYDCGNIKLEWRTN